MLIRIARQVAAKRSEERRSDGLTKATGTLDGVGELSLVVLTMFTESIIRTSGGQQESGVLVRLLLACSRALNLNFRRNTLKRAMKPLCSLIPRHTGKCARGLVRIGVNLARTIVT